MFNFLSMADNYEERKIDHSELDGNTIVDTCSVNDGSKPYETAVMCPKYNNGKWVIVEAYNTKEEAQHGHNKWVAIMASDNQPEKLVDCNNSMISQFAQEILGNDWNTEFEEEF